MTHNSFCPFCRTETGTVCHDDDKSRAYECQHCMAVEKITKGKASWWYHGWQALDDHDQPGERINADGVRGRAPIRFLEWVRDIPAGALSD